MSKLNIFSFIMRHVFQPPQTCGATFAHQTTSFASDTKARNRTTCAQLSQLPPPPGVLRARHGRIESVERVSIQPKGRSYSRTLFARGTDEEYQVR